MMYMYDMARDTIGANKAILFHLATCFALNENVSFKIKCLQLPSCVDINECLPNGGRGPCEQICTNTLGSFDCSCQPGYNVSGYTCNGEDK